MTIDAAATSEGGSEAANTPFDDATRILKLGLDADRPKALDTFMLNSCLVHDMTIVTQALFNQNGHHTSKMLHTSDDWEYAELSAIAGDCQTLAEVSSAIERGVGKESASKGGNSVNDDGIISK